MSLMSVLIVFKDGSERTINNVLHFDYKIESYRYKSQGPVFELKEGIFNELDLVDSHWHIFFLDTIDFIEVF